jgi:purine-cytosine permease-like protein
MKKDYLKMEVINHHAAGIDVGSKTLCCVRAQTAYGPFLPDFYVFSNSQAQRHRVWAGSRAALNGDFSLG